MLTARVYLFNPLSGEPVLLTALSDRSSELAAPSCTDIDSCTARLHIIGRCRVETDARIASTLVNGLILLCESTAEPPQPRIATEVSQVQAAALISALSDDDCRKAILRTADAANSDEQSLMIPAFSKYFVSAYCERLHLSSPTHILRWSVLSWTLRSWAVNATAFDHERTSAQ